MIFLILYLLCGSIFGAVGALIAVQANIAENDRASILIGVWTFLYLAVMWFPIIVKTMVKQWKRKCR